MAQEAVGGGAAFDVFRQVVERQGGDVSLLEDPDRRKGYEPAGTVEAPLDGYVADLDAMSVGRTATAMGSGRTKKEDAVDPLAGIILNKTVGDAVRTGDTLATLYTRRTDNVPDYAARIADAYTIGAGPPSTRSTVLMGRYASKHWDWT